MESFFSNDKKVISTGNQTIITHKQKVGRITRSIKEEGMLRKNLTGSHSEKALMQKRQSNDISPLSIPSCLPIHFPGHTSDMSARTFPYVTHLNTNLSK